MSEDDEPLIIVCIPIAQGFDPEAGSAAIECHECARPVWLSKDGQTFLVEHPHAKAQCLSCVGRVDITPEQLGALPGAGRELADWLEHNRERIVQYLNDQGRDH